MYNYQTELEAASKKDIANGVIQTMTAIDWLGRIGRFALEDILMNNKLCGSSWKQMMFVDLLEEMGYIRKVGGKPEAAQFQMYVKC